MPSFLGRSNLSVYCLYAFVKLFQSQRLCPGQLLLVSSLGLTQHFLCVEEILPIVSQIREIACYTALGSFHTPSYVSNLQKSIRKAAINSALAAVV